MAKKKAEPAKQETIESYLCRTQGIGVMLAKDVVAKMDAKIRSSVQSLIDARRPVNEVMAAFKPAAQPEPEPEEPKPE